MSEPARTRYTPEEYLEFERKSEYKNEFMEGRIYAMTGASRAHNRIAVNICTSLYTQVKGRPCEVYISDMRVKIDPSGSYVYPDIAALCGEPQFEDTELDTLLNPTLIMEVLSPSTEAYDRGEKFFHYRKIQSLMEYLLVAQDRYRVARFVRQEGQWGLSEFSDPADIVRLDSIQCDLPLSSIYDSVEIQE